MNKTKLNNLKIAYIGNRTNKASDGKSFNTENHIAQTLEQLGHEVLFLQENELKRGWVDRLPEDVDLMLYTRTWGTFVTNEDLQRLREKDILSASYHLDLYVGLKRQSGLRDDPFWRTDYVFTPDGDPNSKKVFESYGINHFYIKPGVFKDECVMLDPNRTQMDVVFVGGGNVKGHGNGYGHPREWPYRDKLITWLHRTYGGRFHKYGYPGPTVRGRDLNQLYANSRIVVGDSVCLNFKHEYYWSDRIAETTGRGGFIIHPYIKGLEECYKDKIEAVFYEYNNWQQLKELISYYLEHDDEREAIRLAGHERTKRDHTYHNRLTQMLNILKEGEV